MVRKVHVFAFLGDGLILTDLFRVVVGNYILHKLFIFPSIFSIRLQLFRQTIKPLHYLEANVW